MPKTEKLTFTYKDGDTVEIPDGSTIIRADGVTDKDADGNLHPEGEILYWNLPVTKPEGAIDIVVHRMPNSAAITEWHVYDGSTPLADGEELTWIHPSQSLDYEPHFDRASATRRVLMHISDEDHVGRGPRNTVERLAVELGEDPHSRRFTAGADPSFVQQHVDKLTATGLVECRKDGTLAVTDAGRVELAN
jgi:DNA-binding transcriptional ArsR family regulator